MRIKRFFKRQYHKVKNILKISRRKGLKNKNFSIIANNCGGGYVVDYFGLQYNSPTEGLLIEINDYVKFCLNLKHYLSCELTFIKPEESIHKDIYGTLDKFGFYPIAKCDDIEIHFLHYPTAENARSKWVRRSKRMNYDNFLVLLFEAEYSTIEELKQYDSQLCCVPHIIFIYKQKIVGENFVYNEEVHNHLLHHWKPEWVLATIDWKERLNKLNEQ